MNVRRRHSVGKWVRDYIVPIIWALLIIILLFSVFSWWDTEEVKVDLENKVGLEVIFDGANTESYVVYPWDYKKKIDSEISLYKWEKLIVKNGSVSLSLLWLWDFKLNKLWELKYNESWSFSLYSSDLWLNSSSEVPVEMRFASVNVWNQSNISFSQNEMWSTVYLINWFAEVQNLAWASTVLAPWQKITVSRLNANKEDLDLTLSKEAIDDYYKQSDWFILNNGINYLASWVEAKEETSTWTTKKVKTSSKLITFNNLSDELNVSSDKITVSWNFVDEEITKITLNWANAVINSETKTFKFENVSVANSENDLVFKVYDGANDLLSKFIYTIYYDGAVANNNTSRFNVKTFDVDWSKFTFTSPTTKSTYTTYEDFTTIRWKVLIEWIKKVQVNDYTLKSFNWSTWRYHASTINNNLSIWTNVYEVKYFDINWKLVYTNHFTIVKKDPKTKPKVVEAPKEEVKEEVVEPPKKENYSDEAL